MKTPIQKAIEFAKRLDISRDEKAEFLDFLESLLQEEKEHFVAAWINGNEEGWEQNTDWPEHVERYFNERFGVKATDALPTCRRLEGMKGSASVMRIF